MKKSLYEVVLAVMAAAVLLLASACNAPFAGFAGNALGGGSGGIIEIPPIKPGDSAETGETAEPALELVTFRVVFADSLSRMLVPVAAFDHYEFIFKQGVSTIPPTAKDGLQFTLPAGTYTMDVNAYAKAGTVVSATGTQSIALTQGTPSTVQIALTGVKTDGTGTINYKVTVPSGASITEIRLKDLARTVSDIVETPPAGTTYTYSNGAIPSGIYRVTVKAQKAFPSTAGTNKPRFAEHMEIVHIYRDMTSTNTASGVNIADNEFTRLLSNDAGITNVTVNGTSIWNGSAFGGTGFDTGKNALTIANNAPASVAVVVTQSDPDAAVSGPASSYTVAAGNKVAVNFTVTSENGKVTNPKSFDIIRNIIPITSITNTTVAGIDGKYEANRQYTLAGTISPNDATYKNDPITWSGAGVTSSGNTYTFTPTAAQASAGNATLTAKVSQGANFDEYSQNFQVTVIPAQGDFIAGGFYWADGSLPQDGITITPTTTADGITLTATKTGGGALTSFEWSGSALEALSGGSITSNTVTIDTSLLVSSSPTLSLLASDGTLHYEKRYTLSVSQ